MAHHHLAHFDPFRDLARADPLRNVGEFFRDMGFKTALRDLAGTSAQATRCARWTGRRSRPCWR